MKTLIIIANPSKTSFSHAMAEAYSKKCEEFEILDLYDFNQNYFSYKSTKDYYIDWNPDGISKIKEIQEKISSCDEMAFFFPVWWAGAPAILQNFFDSNFSSWFAFKYHKGWKIEKLLTWKTAKIYCTCDAPWFIYSIPFISWINLKWLFKKSIFWFCGIKLTEFKLFGKFHKLSEDKRKEILKNI